MKAPLVTYFILTMVSFQILATGDNCQSPTPAVLGVNATPSAPYWYSFTMTEPGKKLIISSISYTEVDTHLFVYRECNGEPIAISDDVNGYQSRASVPLGVGETVYMLWSDTWDSSGFSWELTVADVGAAEFCEGATPAVAGINSTPQAPYWYSFTMPVSGKRLIVSSVGHTVLDTYLEAFSDCGGELLAASDDYIDLQSRVSIFNLEAGETVYIHWADAYSSEGFDWSLSVAEIVPGEDCEAAVSAVPGTNTVPQTGHILFWYEYTMTATNSNLVLSTTEEETVYLVVGNCIEQSAIEFGFKELVYGGLSQGDEVMIVWTAENGGGFSWELEVREKQPGETCQNPIEVTPASYTVSLRENWYTYTMTEPDKRVRISSVGEIEGGTYLTVYSACEGLVLGSSDGFEGQCEVSLTSYPGEPIYIKWENPASESIDWILQLEDTPDILVTSNQIEVNAAPGQTAMETLTVKNMGQALLSLQAVSARAAQFDGYDDFITTYNYGSLNPENAITISLWIYLEEGLDCDPATNNWKYLLSNGNPFFGAGYDVIIEESGSLTWSLATEGGSTRYFGQTPLPLREWTHLTFSYNASDSKAKIYLNGEETPGAYGAGQHGSGSIIYNGFEQFMINYPAYSDCSESLGSFSGMVDEVAMWSKPRSASEIAQSVLRSPVGGETGLMIHWNFESSDFLEGFSSFVMDPYHPETPAYLLNGTLLEDASEPGVTPFSWFTVTDEPQAVNPGEETTLEITFNTTVFEGGYYGQSFTLVSNDPDEPLVQIYVGMDLLILGTRDPESAPFFLSQNYPNPFTGTSQLEYELSREGEVNLSVYDLQGKVIGTMVNEYQHRGHHVIELNRQDTHFRDLEAGVYLYRLSVVTSEGIVNAETKRLVITR